MSREISGGMRPRGLVLAGSLLLPAVAFAETNRSLPEDFVADVQGWMVSERAGEPSRLRQVLPSTGVTAAAAGEPVIIYINRAGATLAPGNNDSRTNRSTLVNQTTAIPAWNTSAANWQAIMDCTRTMWAPFNVQITDVDPGNVPHFESIVTTRSSVLGMDPNVGGVSPYTIGCNVIPNSIVFTFADAFGGNAETICEVMAQEVAHSIGLDHEMLASDPMTYLSYNGLQAFRDQTVRCGEYASRNCGLQGECGANQNSYQMLMARVGPRGAGDNGLPDISITAPADGAQVPPGFTVATEASDDGAIQRVELWIDGALVDTRTAAPYTFQTPTSLEDGSHRVETIAYDDAGQSGSAQITVVVARVGGGGGGGGTDPGADSRDPGDLVGGCQAGTGAGASSLALLGLALLGLGRRRRA
jgi:uncharacterized protein (TIGR03382 family)